MKKGKNRPEDVVGEFNDFAVRELEEEQLALVCGEAPNCVCGCGGESNCVCISECNGVCPAPEIEGS